MSGPVLVAFTEGGQARGLGHVMRCLAYAEAWLAEGGKVRWVLDGDEVARAAVGAGADVTLRRWQDDVSAADVARGAQLVLEDSYSATAPVLAALAAAAVTPVFLDDLWGGPYPRGYVVHPAPDAPPMGHGERPPGAVWLTGPSWQALRGPFRERIERAPELETVRRVLVVPGGTDVRGLRGALARLVRTCLPGVLVDVVGAPVGEPLPGVTFHGSVEALRMMALMKRADLAISGAGTTVFELARVGVPTIMLGMVDNQRANLENWPVLAGFVDAGMWDAPDRDSRLEWAMLGLAPRLVRQAISERARACVDGQGIARLFARIRERLAA